MYKFFKFWSGLSTFSAHELDIVLNAREATWRNVLNSLWQTTDFKSDLGAFSYLEDLLHATGNTVVHLSYNIGVHDTRGGIQGIHSRVDTQLSNSTRQHSGGVQMGEGGGWGGICQIVSGHVDGLHRGDGALLGGGDTLLHSTHVSGQGWLVAYSRGDTAQQGRHLQHTVKGWGSEIGRRAAVRQRWSCFISLMA